MKKTTAFERELGKAICDRFGLNHNTTLEDYTTESAGKTVWITMTTMCGISADEYAELVQVANKRALEGSEAGDE